VLEKDLMIGRKKEKGELCVTVLDFGASDLENVWVVYVFYFRWLSFSFFSSSKK